MNKLVKQMIRSVYAPIFLGAIFSFYSLLIPGKSLYWGTASLQFIPWRVFSLNQLNQGVIPLWNHLSGMGAPLLANYQLAIFYPPGWLTFLFGWIAETSGVAWSFGLLLIGHTIWAGIGMVKLMKRLGVSETGQIIAGLAFSLSSYWIARGSFFSMVWAGSWMPWVILSASDIANPVDVIITQKRFLPIFFTLTLCMQLLAGHAQLTWYSLLLTIVWVVVGCARSRNIKQSLVSLFRMAAGVVLAVGISAIQLIPTAEYLMNSQRADAYAYEQAMVYSFWPWRLLTFFAPNLFGSPGNGTYWGYAAYWEDAVYIGFIPFILAIQTFFKTKDSHNTHFERFGFLRRLLWIVVIVAFCLALGDNLPFFPWLYRNIPTFNMFQAPSRWIVLCVFGFSVLAGIQAGLWRKPLVKKGKRARLFMVGAVAIVVGAFSAKLILPDIQPSFIVAALGVGTGILIMNILGVSAPRLGCETKPAWKWMVVGTIILDLVIFNWGLNPTTTISNTTLKPNSIISQIQQSGYRVYLSSDDEYSLKFRRFLRFADLRPIEDLANYYNSLLPNLNLFYEIPSANNFDPLTPERYSIYFRWLETLPENLQHIVFERINIGWIEKRITNTPEGTLFIKLSPEMKVTWKSCAKWVKDPNDALLSLEKIISQDDQEDWIILEGDNSDNSKDCEKSNARLEYNESSQKITIRVQAEAKGWILLANTWFPGWNVYVDGIKKVNYQADYLFQAVPMDEGTHVVEWRYEPISFIIGGILSGSSIIFVLIWICWPRNYKRHIRSLGKHD